MKLGSRLARAFLVAPLLVALFSRSVLAETGVTDKEILLGTANTLSGPSEYVGREMNIGFQTYVNYVNDNGGVSGRKIKVTSCDDKYETDSAILCFRKLVSDGVFGITGCYGAALIAKYIPLAMNAKIPLVGFSSGPVIAAQPVKRYVFTIRPDFVQEQSQMVDKLWDEGGMRKVAVIYQADLYGNNILTGRARFPQKAQ